jgi:hypothetical protein
MLVEHSLNTFRIDINFPESDVDMVYREARSAGVSTPCTFPFMNGTDSHKCQNEITPTSRSVDYCLSRFWTDDNTRTREASKFRKMGIEVKQTHGLIMGTCFIVFEVYAENYSPELVQKATEIVRNTFDKYIQYHKKAA